MWKKEGDVMTAEQNRALVRQFPFLLPRNAWTGEVASDYDYSYTELDAMPDGWRKAFGMQLCQELSEALQEADFLEQYRILQIKEKYGALCWYDNGAPEAAQKILAKYEALSMKTCIRCGKPATKYTTGWVAPYCDDCFPCRGKSEDTRHKS